MKRAIKIYFTVVFIIVFASIYLYCAIQHSKIININMKEFDQSAYMDFAKKMYASKYTYLGDRNRMPVYPFIQSLFYKSNMDDENFFARGKYVNIILSLFILFCLFFIFYKYFKLFYAVNLLFIVAFSVFMFKAAYFQCELLFYFLNFLSFLLMYKILIELTWRWAIVAGGVFGLTYLTKVSSLPGVTFFFIFLIIQSIFMFYRIISNNVDTSITTQYKNKFKSQLFCTIFAAITFILTIYPYISDTKKRYDHYFYNVNSTFYFWCDSWKEAASSTKAHGDREGWPIMPSESIPSFKKYFHEHNIGDVLNRITKGMYVVVGTAYLSYGYFRYSYIYFVFFLLLIFLKRKVPSNEKKLTKNYFLLLFFLLYFIMYFFIYAWYVPIAPGVRFMLAHFLPFIFMISLFILEYSKDIFIELNDYKINILTIFNFFILNIFITDFFVLVRKVLTMYAGE